MLFYLLALLYFRQCVEAESPNNPYSSDDLHKTYPDYGKTWMFFPDGNGRPRVMILEGDGNYSSTKNLRFLPELYVIFNLYTRDNPNDTFILQPDDTNNFEKSPFNVSKDTKFITHGWMSSSTSNTCQTIKNAILIKEDVNVIIVDWETIAGNIFYPMSMSRTKDVGVYYGRMIDFLVDQGASSSKMHLIGHSLGAHVSGIAAHSTTNGKIARITGLDPALPGFEFLADLADRLDPTDANFVDIIHTCAGVLGFFYQLGHMDAYPNGGTPAQPGCCCLAEITEACSHGRSWQIFAESIISDIGFVAVQCDTWKLYKSKNCTGEPKRIGYPASTDTIGTYYFTTNDAPPFARAEIYNDEYFEDEGNSI